VVVPTPTFHSNLPISLSTSHVFSLEPHFPLRVFSTFQHASWTTPSRGCRSHNSAQTTHRIARAASSQEDAVKQVGCEARLNLRLADVCIFRVHHQANSRRVQLPARLTRLPRDPARPRRASFEASTQLHAPSSVLDSSTQSLSRSGSDGLSVLAASRFLSDGLWKVCLTARRML
jgi:hypothetical protein